MGTTRSFPSDHFLEMIVQVKLVVGALGRALHRATVRKHQQHAPRCAVLHLTLAGPLHGLAIQAFAIMVQLEQCCDGIAAVGFAFTGAFVNVVHAFGHATRIKRLACTQPGTTRLPTVPGSGGKTQHLDGNLGNSRHAAPDIGPKRHRFRVCLHGT